MALEHFTTSIEEHETAIRMAVRNLMTNIRNSMKQISQHMEDHRSEVEAILGGEDAETLVEMYKELQKVVDLVNGDPPPDLPEE